MRFKVQPLFYGGLTMKLTFRHLLGAIIAVIGLTFIFSIPITNYMITSFHPTVEHLKSKPADISYDWDSVQLINLFNVAQARINSASIHVIGAIYNEKVELNTPIAEGINNSIAALCASTLYPNEKMGKNNYILAAHNLHSSRKALFSPLFRYISSGNEINITDFKQNYTYQITSRKIVSPQNLSALTPTSNATLTLITCDQTNRRRVIYRGKLIKVEKFTQLPIHTKLYLKQKFKY